MVKELYIFTEIKGKYGGIRAYLFRYINFYENRGKHVKITFQATENPEVVNHNHAGRREVKQNGKVSAYGAVFARNGQNGWFAKGSKEKSKSFGQLQQDAGQVDVGIMQDYKILLSHTMSKEDYAKLEKEGFDFSNMDPETAVTIVDKIKVQLARSGQHIAGYTDDLDHDTLAAALGSESLASAVGESFGQADIPLTEENVRDVKAAWEMTSQLSMPTEGTYQYMVDNGMEPQIQNFYLSQSSGAATGGRQPKFYAEDIQGYYTESATGNSLSGLQGEIEKILTREGLPVNEENSEAAEKLFNGGLPITKENIQLLQELQSVEFPVTEERFAHAAANAILEGKPPVYGNLAQSSNLYDKANELMDYFGDDAQQMPRLYDIISRRQLEEIRLRMTAEVNVALLKSGFSIDTAPMEELIEALKKAEAEVASKYFPQDENAVSKYELYNNTTAVVHDLPHMPAQLLGNWSVTEYTGTLAEFHEEGAVLQETYAKAQTSYETLMTAPRKDLGDNIQKAFANVDAILEDLNLEITEANRRAVRILGYNRMTIEAENINRVKLADEQVRAVVEKMTPASTLKMIRDGKNPLEMSFAELEAYFNELPEEYEKTAESYSRFLYGLERNRQITEEERSSYIGIYRMLHQIDASDGAVVGALVNVGAELHFSNLLSAVRSGKFKSMDVSVTDKFGDTMEVIRKGESISEQIARGFVEAANAMLTEVSYSEESAKAYTEAQWEQMRQAANVDEDAVEMLIRGQLPRNAGNLLAAQVLSDQSYNPFKEWRMKKTQLAHKMEEAQNSSADKETDFVEKLDDKEVFREQYQEMIASVKGEVEEASLQQTEDDVDVRGLKLLHKQFALAGNLAREEEYVFPMYVGQELTKVHLTLNRGGEEKGTVNVTVTLSLEEIMEGHFHAENGKITGFLTGNTYLAVTKLERVADKFIDVVSKTTENGWFIDALPVVNRQETQMLHRKQASVNREVPDEENYRDVDNRELYRIAKVFLEAVKVV